ncbi:group II intron reverse transcriptase/maturase [Deinococcus aluminii]|uniref:Reverse transcriptase domain-containing protein n=1 Tax=Deinococcus aluminii TaxID=1656885 RepID=A0ABP9X9V3_9DEIO
MQFTANRAKEPTDWNAINWREQHRKVNNLRKRLFRATREGDHRKVRSLQKLLLRSRANTLLSVRRVTQNNAGKNTPGVDKVLVKTPKARGELVDALMTLQPWRVRPTRRVHIPKKNGKTRPLGIPTIQDRCLQARVKTALEPEWEAKFEGSSYGFRPGRGCHDALLDIWLTVSKGRKVWVLDADIRGAFDHIDHEHLLNAIGAFPARELVKQWLKAGFEEDGLRQDTVMGTPQGGVISPLLANIALHGMEDCLGVRYLQKKEGPTRHPQSVAVVRYADDFVVLADERSKVEDARKKLEAWLGIRGLSLSEEKTRIVHLREGFDFLGFNIRQFPTSKRKKGLIVLTKPSKAAVKAIRGRLGEEWRKLAGTNAKTVVERINPIILGWANYFRVGASTTTFRALDDYNTRRAIRWTKRTHPNKSKKWRLARYFGRFNSQHSGNRWVFGDWTTGKHVKKLAWTGIQRHRKVRGTASPDDPTLAEYWKERRTREGKMLLSLSRLAHQQRYTCPVCGDALLNGEELHRHHYITDRNDVERHKTQNLQLVHLMCHQQVHAPGNKPARAKRLLRMAKGLLEPDDGKLSRPVLRGEGDQQ